MPKSSSDFEYTYKISKEVKAPVKSGDKLGEIIVKCDNKAISTVNLVAKDNINKIDLKYIFVYLLRNI